MSSPAPIGVFDSGVGGLTVVRAIRERLPHESILYLGDTARVPYGTKSADVVRRYAVNCARFLADQGAKAIVVACNTAGAVAVPEIERALALPVIGVIEPGARLAAAHSVGRIGVIGTEGTIRSGRYQAIIKEAAPNARVFATPCPLFVPLAEEGMAGHAVTATLASEYLAPLLADRIDTLVLGCTHYPLLRSVIGATCGEAVEIIDSASAVAEATEQLLDANDLRAAPDAAGSAHFFATDVGDRFARVGRWFLGSELKSVDWIDVG